jgi:hypothetical protein
MEIIYIESYNENTKPDIDKPFEKVIIRKPRFPKIAKVDRFKQVGHRKWATIYHVRDECSNILFSHEKLCVAIKEAKRLSLSKIKNYYVTIGKSLINSDPKVATISPGKHKPGKFKFIVLQ